MKYVKLHFKQTILSLLGNIFVRVFILDKLGQSSIEE